MPDTPSAAPVDILVIEDDPDLRQLLLEELTDAGHRCAGKGDLASARQWLSEEAPKLVVSDLHLPDGNGLDLLEELRQLPVRPSFIAITAFGTIDQAVDALKRGADDFLTKPLDLDHFTLSITRTLQRQQLEQELSYYRRLLDQGEFHGMIGRSPRMRQLFTQIQQVAQAGGPVLVTGESGVGKELVARAIHRESDRRDGPFIALNCGGIAANLLESELFGHAAGAFTGASKARRGLFAAADGGTLMLDEIGEMPMEMQSSLLRVLQDGRVRPVGSNTEQDLNVRIIAATNRELPDEVSEGRFREDLYYRLETFTIEVPPLRQRGDDLERLIAHMVHQFNQRRQQPVDGLSGEALNLLKRYPFPGNVRELSNIIERAVTFCSERLIGPEHLPERIHQATPTPEPASGDSWQPPTGEGELVSLDAVERSYIHYVLDQVDGNKKRAADILNIGRRTLYRWLETDA
ncbi:MULTISPECIES: sigma-54-dependent transcriptional regulator [unclassified Marinimicrobium]|jgi:DNA-binding NtrC family response regulator|uniref:sigma-54-dependent transcriptional regulator n=1 Tax=unclassified Marinimicrobium TaxID=2632100 RepID=UPI00257BCDA5|nr:MULTISPECIES: sigma-54 dependent transcriptional regulator [unclassified Marinimicrobium]